MSETFHQAQHMQAAIRKAVLEEWDPIGVKEIPEAANEYDGYVPTIYRLLTQKKTKEEIFEYLWWIETEHMGLTGDKHATNAFADRLLILTNE